MYHYINQQKTVIISILCTYCYEYVLRMSLHKVHILLNNCVAELAIPNTHFPQPARVLCPCSHIVVLPKRLHSSLIIIHFISIKTYIHQRPKSMFKHRWYNFREYIRGVEITPAAGCR